MYSMNNIAFYFYYISKFTVRFVDVCIKFHIRTCKEVIRLTSFLIKIRKILKYLVSDGGKEVEFEKTKNLIWFHWSYFDRICIQLEWNEVKSYTKLRQSVVITLF